MSDPRHPGNPEPNPGSWQQPGPFPGQPAYGQPPPQAPYGQYQYPPQYVAPPPRRPNHILHLILTVLTCGAWGSVWIVLAARYWGVVDYRNPAEHPGMQRRTWIAIGSIVAVSVILGIIGSFAPSNSTGTAATTAGTSAPAAAGTTAAPKTAEGVSAACVNAMVANENGTGDSDSVIATCIKAGDSIDAINAYVDSIIGPTPTPKAKPKRTVAQREAVESAQSYIDMSGFSRAGLLQQLTSKAGEGFKRADALYAVNHVRVDWNAEAVESAKAYLEMTGFSRAGLIQQLHSSAGDGYTLKQATYAANKVGLK